MDTDARLRAGYDRAAQTRTGYEPPAYETAHRDQFVRLLGETDARTVVELGAAVGHDACALRDAGFEVVCTDISPEMVRLCRDKGFDAHVMGVSDLTFADGTFSAAYAKNCLVHVPKADWAATLAGIARVVEPGGLCYLSMYGGIAFEGIHEEDYFDPKRFFSFHEDDAVRALVAESFDIVSFDVVPHGGFWGTHYQSLVLRVPHGL